MLSILQAGAASSKAYARVWQRTRRNVLLDGKPARRREVVLQMRLERGEAYCLVPCCTTKQAANPHPHPSPSPNPNPNPNPDPNQP